MEMQKNQKELYLITVPDGESFSYKIEPYELINFLGVRISMLQEYSFVNKIGETYKLYKTKEGNWYDILEEELTEKTTIVRLLKGAIEKLEENE